MVTTAQGIRFVAGALITDKAWSLKNLKQITKATVSFHDKAWRRGSAGEPGHTFVQVESGAADAHTIGSLEIDFLREDHLINAAARYGETKKDRVHEPTLMFAIGRLPFCIAWLRYLAHLAAEPADWHERLMRELERGEPGDMIWYDSTKDTVARV